jgi:hypothetical protein
MVTKVFFQGFVIFLRSDEKVNINHQQLLGSKKQQLKNFATSQK